MTVKDVFLGLLFGAINKALAEEAAEDLAGTCQSIADLGEKFEIAFNDSKEFCERLDELVFECSQCNWWCRIEEMSENHDDVCDECDDV